MALPGTNENSPGGAFEGSQEKRRSETEIAEPLAIYGHPTKRVRNDRLYEVPTTASASATVAHRNMGTGSAGAQHSNLAASWRSSSTSLSVASSTSPALTPAFTFCSSELSSKIFNTSRSTVNAILLPPPTIEPFISYADAYTSIAGSVNHVFLHIDSYDPPQSSDLPGLTDEHLKQAYDHKLVWGSDGGLRSLQPELPIITKTPRTPSVWKFEALKLALHIFPEHRYLQPL
ncbi:hypothetical protein B0T24DRAFT_312391 [Lasiosphaeria ovina]|uniref:Uncharacterized protein n=1 Tax=Lasiosphaeria ovina TaxID=92902 RepID=A0AAE0K740_9PEZI|nr:hypothetical protein B0T24DRAFT_312391 [Lasiosphaeria ovina]